MRACLEEAGVQMREATDRNCIEGRAGRGELAHDSEAHRYDRHGKCGACARKHRVLTWGDLPRKRKRKLNERWPGCASPKRPASMRAAPHQGRPKRAATFNDGSAPRPAMAEETWQKSAAVIVAGRVRAGEGPNNETQGADGMISANPHYPQTGKASRRANRPEP